MAEFVVIDWLTVAGVCVLGAISPGPSLAIVVKHTLIGGRINGMIAAATHGLTVGVYALLSISGLALLIKNSSFVFTTLQGFGVIYLLWLGLKGVFAKTDKPKTPEPSALTKNNHNGSKPCSHSAPDAMKDGFMIVFLNPKIAVFFISLFSQFIQPSSPLLLKAVYVITALVIDAGWYMFVVWLISMPLWLERLQQRAVAIERLFGSVLLGLASVLLYDLLNWHK